jgi:hypothetical protein
MKRPMFLLSANTAATLKQLDRNQKNITENEQGVSEHVILQNVNSCLYESIQWYH